MSRKVLTALALAMLLVLSAGVALAWNPTNGDYSIYSAADLQAFSTAVTAGNKFADNVIELKNDIDLAGIEWQPIGGESVYFAGEFDGNGYTIKNLTNTQDVARKGLFGLVEKAYLHDFTLKNVKFSGSAADMRVGAVAGNLQYWNVLENITVDGLTYDLNTDGLVGGVVGYAWKSQMKNVNVNNANIKIAGDGYVVGGSIAYGRAHIWDTGVTGNNKHWLDGTVVDGAGVNAGKVYVLQNYSEDCNVNNIKIVASGSGELGGFFGSDTYNSHSNYFKNCAVTGLDMQLQGSGSYTAGGFVAWNNGTSHAASSTLASPVKGYDGCSAQGKITASNASGLFGGFVGQLGGRASSFENATADVDIVSNGIAGGFVGQTAQYTAHQLSFTNCTADGDVKGDIVGGFAGESTLGGDGDQIYVDYFGCTANGNVNGRIAGGFLGMTDPELPATNWSKVEGTGKLAAINCVATGDVNGSEYAGSFLGYGKTLTENDKTDGTKTEIDLDGIMVKNTNLPLIGNETTVDDNENITLNTVPFISAVLLDGESNLYVNGSAVFSGTGDLVFKSSVDFDFFKRALVLHNDQIVADIAYPALQNADGTVKVSEGSIKVTLSEAFLAKQPNGVYTIVIEDRYTEGVSGTFNIAVHHDLKGRAPQTGDNSNIALWISLMAISALSFVALGRKSRFN